jgi:hypothetical protein
MFLLMIREKLMKIKIFIFASALVILFSIIAMAGDFYDNGDGIVTDKNTRLMWQQGEGGLMIWEDAISYCEGLTIARYTDWRLPNIKELESITDDNIDIDTNFFPDVNENGMYYYWSSTTLASDSSFAWTVSFSYGQVAHHSKRGNGYVRCVRGGQ